MTSPYREQQQRQLPFRVYDQYIIWGKTMFKAKDVSGVRYKATKYKDEPEQNEWHVLMQGSVKNSQYGDYTYVFITKPDSFSLEELAAALKEAMENDPTIKLLNSKS